MTEVQYKDFLTFHFITLHNNKINYFTLYKTLNCRKVVKRVRNSVHAVRRSMMAIGRPPELPPKQNSTNRSQPNKYTEHQLRPAPAAPQAAPRKIPNIVVIPEKPKPPVPRPKLHPILDMQTTVPRNYVPESKAPQTPPIPTDRPPVVVQLATLMKTKRDKRESRSVSIEAEWRFLPTAYVVRDGRLYFHFVCQSTPREGGTPARSRWGGVPPSSLGWGVPPSSLGQGVPPIPGGKGYPHHGVPPGQV